MDNNNKWSYAVTGVFPSAPLLHPLFLADRTNGRAIGTVGYVLRLSSVCLSSVT